MEKDDNAAPRPLNNDSKGPWDFPGQGGGTNEPPRKGRGKSDGEPVASDQDDEPKRPTNPWEPQKASGKKPRGPSLEELFRRPGGGKGGGSGFTGLPQRPNGKSWWPLILGGVALLWLGWTSVHRLDSQEQGVITSSANIRALWTPGLPSHGPRRLSRCRKSTRKGLGVPPLDRQRPATTIWF